MQAVAATDDDDERRRRVARLVDRRMREIAFDPAAWLAAQPGATPGDQARAAQALLLPLPSETPLASDASPSSLVRATLLEASYQLK